MVSRLAESEDYQTRLMRVEVDVQNKDGRLKQGMYGRALSILTEGTPGAMQIPSAALSRARRMMAMEPFASCAMGRSRLSLSSTERITESMWKFSPG